VYLISQGKGRTQIKSVIQNTGASEKENEGSVEGIA
jgi:hypothetical protein